ncbi:hypothetical protein [Qipengyuania soli]|uniref:SH3 domain-containing protein n=1 Tax=Qipengyuania soli TaxID=2782568 RepID=A0A7S8F5H2_9SPHN|nr:hypothetical protein [Qipengyuania soli]QPC99473.1 hypothetical protein IRL76_02560 [Qipengyuania soli]
MRNFMLATALLALAACSGGADEPVARESGADAFPDQPEPAAVGRFAPQNDCVELPNAKLFFVDLGKAVRDRDANALLKLTSKDVKLDFGGGGGLTTFRERLEAEEGQLWKELDEILMLGCGRDEAGNMVLPWLFSQDLGVDDPFSTMVTMGPDVVMRDKPASTGAVVETIPWDTVQLADGFDPKAPFAKVTTRSGKEGYIATDKLRSPLDYRITAAPAGDGWQIVSFVAGD